MSNRDIVEAFVAWKGPVAPENPVSGTIWIESEDCDGEVLVVKRRENVILTTVEEIE